MSNNAWNSDYNSAKGSLLVGNGTRPVVRTVGTNGQVLTADSTQADGVKWAAAGGGSTINMSPYIVGPTQSDFTTITAAIAQAVSDGASASNQINLLIKADTYVESFTLPDGVNLIGVDGFVQTPNFNGLGTQKNAATIQGNITFTAGEMKIHNLNISPVSGSAFTYNSAGTFVLQFRNLRVQAGDTSPLMTSNAASALFLNADSCLFAPTTGPFFNITNTSAAAQVEFLNCLTTQGTTPSTIDCTFFLEAYASNIGEAFFNSSSNQTTLIYNNSIVYIPGATLINSGTAQNTVYFNNCFVYNSNNIVDSSNTNSQFQAANSNFLSQVLYACPGLVSFTDCSFNSIFGGNGQVEILKVSNPTNGAFQTSEQWRTGNSITTTNNTPTTIYSLAVNADETYVITARIVGSTDIPHVDATGGTLMCVVNSNSGAVAIVGAVTTDIKATTTGSFGASVSGFNLNITVTGLAATNYHWVAYIEHHKVIDNN